MSTEAGRQRMAAILAADVTSGWMPIDESQELTHKELDRRRNLFFYHLQPFRGRVLPSDRDAVLVEFASPVDAVCCAMDIQRANIRRNQEVPLELRMQLRIGISLGKVNIDEEFITGPGVEEAMSLEEHAEPGGIAINARVHELAVQRVTLHTLPLELPGVVAPKQKGRKSAPEAAENKEADAEGKDAGKPSPCAYKVLTDPASIEEFANSLLKPSEHDRGGMGFLTFMLVMLFGSILYMLYLQMG